MGAEDGVSYGDLSKQFSQDTGNPSSVENEENSSIELKISRSDISALDLVLTSAEHRLSTYPQIKSEVMKTNIKNAHDLIASLRLQAKG